ncbi:MAG: hypothetical protein ACTSQJ_09400 [Promethearchaeota archaeon]
MNTKNRKIILLIIHWIIIINFILEILYGAYQTFIVLAPEGHTGPLFNTAQDLSYEDMVIRRLYAIETWIAITGLSIYLAITEINPRLKKIRET